MLEEEVNQALGCGSYERAEDRRGYRNGAETRRVTTSVGTRELRVPRARVRDEETGETTEFRSELLPRYARRTREVDEAILGTYLSGANSRRIRKALKPVVSKNTNELKIGAPGPFRSSSIRGEPQIWGSEAMSAIRVLRTRRENTVQKGDATLPSGNLGPGPGCTWTRTC